MSVLAAFISGREARAADDQRARQSAMAQFLQQNGQAVFSGDQSALGQLAGFGPEGLTAAFDIQGRQQAMAMDQERLALARAEGSRAAQRFQMEMTAQERAQEAEKLRQGLTMAGQFYQAGDQRAYNQMLAEYGLDPAQFPFESFPIVAAQAEGVLETLTAAQEFANPPAPEAPAAFEALRLRAQEAGLQPGTPEYQSFMQTGGSQPPQTTINVGGGENRQVFDAMLQSATSARAAVTGLRALQEAERAITEGAITGFGADQRLYLQRLGSYLGVTDPTAVQNTETFRAAIAPQVAALMKETVGSTQISNADREFAERAAGGSIDLDEGTIKRLVSIMRRASEATVQSHIERLNTVYPEGQGFDRERAILGVRNPVTPPPAATDPAGVPAGSPGAVPSLTDLTPEELDVIRRNR